jgi:hypothetical protein
MTATPTMTVMGIAYIEDKPKKTRDPMSGVCGQCALYANTPACSFAIEHSPSMFGGDCMERDVIYVKEAA